MVPWNMMVCGKMTKRQFNFFIHFIRSYNLEVNNEVPKLKNSQQELKGQGNGDSH